MTGIIGLGVAESVRSGRLAGVRWESVKAVAMGTAVALITITSAALVILWVIVVLLVEIWQPFLIAMGAIAGVGAMITTFTRHRSMFYASAFATIAVLLLLLL
ncbi:MAG: hypothetical protein IIC33_03765 [Chloroflexi bacterium]|nr:hypothetical protein [Chloroflexota bacterium]